MKGFALDEQGDLLIENGEIQMVHGADLTKQTIKSVLGTKNGEWFLDWEEGIDYNAIFGKKRYASQNTPLDNQLLAEIDEMKQQSAQNDKDKQALNELLEKRLDGDI